MEPGRAVERDPDRTLPHLVVGNIAPAVADGRHAVKRLVGDGLRIGADIFTDGHDLLAARVLYLTPRRAPDAVRADDLLLRRRPLVRDADPGSGRRVAVLGRRMGGPVRHLAQRSWRRRWAPGRMSPRSCSKGPTRCARPSPTPEATTTIGWRTSPRCWRTPRPIAVRASVRRSRRSCRS